jgi:hypothetical protein
VHVLIAFSSDVLCVLLYSTVQYDNEEAETNRGKMKGGNLDGKEEVIRKVREENEKIN